MKIPVRISQTKDNKYRAACQSLPGCVITAESYEDAEAQVQQAVEGYLASLNVVHTVKLETDRNSKLSEFDIPVSREET